MLLINVLIIVSLIFMCMFDKCVIDRVISGSQVIVEKREVVIFSIVSARSKSGWQPCKLSLRVSVMIFQLLTLIS